MSTESEDKIFKVRGNELSEYGNWASKNRLAFNAALESGNMEALEKMRDYLGKLLGPMGLTLLNSWFDRYYNENIASDETDEDVGTRPLKLSQPTLIQPNDETMNNYYSNVEQNHDTLINLLRSQKIHTPSGEFDDSTSLPEGWQSADHFASLIKRSVLNTEIGLFVKMFAPVAGEYGETAYQATSALSQLDVAIPILRPIILLEDNGINGMVFPLGKSKYEASYGRIFSNYDTTRISNVVSSYGLTPLSPDLRIGDNIGLIVLNHKEYAVDAFEDSDTKIKSFLRQK